MQKEVKKMDWNCECETLSRCSIRKNTLHKNLARKKWMTNKEVESTVWWSIIHEHRTWDYVWFYWVGKGEVGRKHSLCYALIPRYSDILSSSFLWNSTLSLKLEEKRRGMGSQSCFLSTQGQCSAAVLPFQSGTFLV